MTKKTSSRAFVMGVGLLLAFFLMAFSQPAIGNSSIKRLTHSKNNRMLTASISGNGRYAIYTLEILSDPDPVKSIRLIDIDSGVESEIFTEGKTEISNQNGAGTFLAGSKPPLLSGDGTRAFFLLSLGKPENRIDHVLAVATPASGEIRIFEFPIQALAGMDAEALGFQGVNWERISNFAVSEDGTRIACVMKGHLGPRRYGNCSGIILLDLSDKTRRTVLGPEFGKQGWKWSSFPRNPLLGGGWAFALSGNGEKVLFGAQSSEELSDYDLYSIDWISGETKRITDFRDRWFSLAGMDFSGKQVIFYYNGEKKQGIGTYRVGSDGTGLRVLASPSLPRIELVAMAGDGSLITYKNIYRGMALDPETGKEFVLFDDRIPGYARGLVPMDFPQIPAFWAPKIVSLRGDRVLLAGPPQGRQAFELYVLFNNMSAASR